MPIGPSGAETAKPEIKPLNKKTILKAYSIYKRTSQPTHADYALN